MRKIVEVGYFYIKLLFTYHNKKQFYTNQDETGNSRYPVFLL